TCNAACTYCNGASCVTRNANDNPECGTCLRCDGASTTCQNFSGASGNSCNSSTTYCCDGVCVSPGAEFGFPCGNGDCGGTWSCSGSSARCSKAGSACAECNADNTRNGTCANDGSSCIASDTQCPACQSCQDNGTMAVCSASSYFNGDTD